MAGLHVNAVISALSAVDAPRHSRLRRAALALSVAVGGIVLSLLLGWLLWTRERELLRVQFERDAGKRVEAIQRVATDQLGAVNIVAAFFGGSRLVQRSEFRTFAVPIIARHPGIEALAWLPHIAGPRRQAHQQAVRAEGFPDYEIGQHDDRGNLVSAGQRDDYYPILFCEPIRKDRSLIGLDVGANAVLRAAISKATATARPAVAIGPPLDATGGADNLLYVVEPAWNENGDMEQRPADQPDIDGFVLGVFKIGTLVDRALTFFTPLGIDVYVSASSQGVQTPLYTRFSTLHIHDAVRPVNGPATPPEGGMHVKGDVDLGSSHWTVDCVPMAIYEARHDTWGPEEALLAGLAITALLVGYLLLLTGRAARVEQLVAKRTRELGESEQRFREEQRLLREMLDLQENERKLMAYEIHDGLAQQLTGAIYKFQTVDRLRADDPAAAQKMYDEAVRLLGAAMAETRRLISGLRPPVLDESGVVAAIEYLIAEHRQHGGQEIEFVHNMGQRRLAPPLESAVFRIVQECLTNACRYSQSARVRVELAQTGGLMRVDVQDWGVGFDPAKVQGEHYGLQGIRERARLLGGAATIQAAPQQGAHIVVKLPVVSQANNGTDKGTADQRDR